MNNDKFRNEFAKKITKAKNKTELFVKKFIVDLDAAIVLKTPVDVGNLHWNWFIGNGSPNLSTEEHEGTNKTGAITRNNAVINSINVKGQTIYVSNSLPYAYRIEYEGWSKVKAPAGMLRVSLVESQQIANKVGIELRLLD